MIKHKKLTKLALTLLLTLTTLVTMSHGSNAILVSERLTAGAQATNRDFVLNYNGSQVASYDFDYQAALLEDGILNVSQQEMVAMHFHVYFAGHSYSKSVVQFTEDGITKEADFFPLAELSEQSVFLPGNAENVTFVVAGSLTLTADPGAVHVQQLTLELVEAEADGDLDVYPQFYKISTPQSRQSLLVFNVLTYSMNATTMTLMYEIKQDGLSTLGLVIWLYEMELEMVPISNEFLSAAPSQMVNHTIESTAGIHWFQIRYQLDKGVTGSISISNATWAKPETEESQTIDRVTIPTNSSSGQSFWSNFIDDLGEQLSVDELALFKMPKSIWGVLELLDIWAIYWLLRRKG